MGTVELKPSLHELIENIEDNKVLNAIYVLLVNQFKAEKKIDFWDELPDEVKKDIEEAIDEGNRDEVFTHEEVKKKMKEKYNIEL
ncbi:MAG: hypothetical protein B6I20_03850 [Bacteroidetes bacterium 4572_117]|nr:MAG: hypothetical protein B6I20_03850 [Bacteroidetes bacterium 4572_117]